MTIQDSNAILSRLLHNIDGEKLDSGAALLEWLGQKLSNGDFGSFMLEVFNSVRTEKGRYSEILVETPTTKGVARLPGDPFTHLIFTSDARENAKIRQHAEQKGLTQIEAILDLTGKAA